MKNLKFEYKITLIYIIIGGLWILFSDKFLLLLAFNNVDLLSKLQTYKGWFYVIVTAALFFLFIKKHLEKKRDTEAELKKHRYNLQELVDEKTIDLEYLNKKLKSTNKDILLKSDLINKQNNELKEALRKLQKTQSKLIQADKMASLGTLTSGIAHEINNPLNYILGAYNGLQNYFNKHGSHDQEKTGFFLTSIKTGIDRAVGIVQGLNEFSRSNDDFEEDCNLHTIIDNCLLMLYNQTKDKIKITKKYAEQELVIKGNIGKLHQVFINILTNSIQAITGEGEIEIKTEKNESGIIIQIHDNGCGINKEHINKTTDPFFTTKPPGKGTGLGLSIAYSIIKDHGGEIVFESEVDQWTNVTVHF